MNHSGYAHPEVLVDTNWVREHLHDPTLRIVEVDVDTKAYNAGHVPGAIGLNWQTQLQDGVRRDVITAPAFAQLMGSSGISPGDTVVLYGDNHNWFAAYGFWLFKLYGHRDVRLMNGGRIKWLNESDKPMVPEAPAFAPVTYRLPRANQAVRALLHEVMDAAEHGSANLVDVRSHEEYTGQVIAPPGMSETAQRGGHVPGAVNIPWNSAVNMGDGTFKSADELNAIYIDGGQLEPHRETIAYCRIGERSSHTWFVLRYLLGLETVKNYDGSWTEYGSLIGAPVEKGAAALAHA